MLCCALFTFSAIKNWKLYNFFWHNLYFYGVQKTPSLWRPVLTLTCTRRYLIILLIIKLSFENHNVSHTLLTSLLSTLFTDLERRSWNSYTAPCNGVVSHGAQIGGIWVFADHTLGSKHKQNASMIFARVSIFMLRQQYIYTRQIIYHESVILIVEKPEYP